MKALKEAEKELNAINRKIDWQYRRLHFLYEEHLKFGGVEDFGKKKNRTWPESTLKKHISSSDAQYIFFNFYKINRSLV